MTSDIGDILGGLESSFNFEGGDTGRDQIGSQFVGRQILRAQQILLRTEVNLLAITDQVVGKSAGLSTLASIRTSPSQRFAGQTLPGISDTQRPMNEAFQFNRSRFSQLQDVSQRQFSRQNHPFHAQFFRHPDAFGAGQRHLG